MFKIYILIFFVFSLEAMSAPKFKVFHSWEGARDEYKTKYEPLLASLDARESYNVLKHEELEYIEIEHITKILFTAFENLYPNLMLVKDVPKILILDSQEENAAALNGIFKDEKPYVFLVHKKLLDLKYDTLVGVIAHELAHLFLQWEQQNSVYPKVRYYVAKNGSIVFGNTLEKSNVKDTQNSDELAVKVQKYMAAFEEYGPFDNLELGGIPLHYDQSEVSEFRILQYMLSSAPVSTDCKIAENLYSDYINNVLLQYLNTENYRIAIPVHEKSIVSEKSKEFEASLRLCFEGIRYSMEEVLFAYGLPSNLFELIIKNASKQEKIDFEKEMLKFSTGDTIDIIIKSVKEDRQKLRQAKQKLSVSLKDIRVYTHEDHADEVAVEVLHSIGISPAGFNQFLTRNENRAACESTRGEAPYYGAIDSEHHSGCWRAFRNLKYFELLSKEVSFH